MDYRQIFNSSQFEVVIHDIFMARDTEKVYWHFSNCILALISSLNYFILLWIIPLLMYIWIVWNVYLYYPPDTQRIAEKRPGKWPFRINWLTLSVPDWHAQYHKDVNAKSAGYIYLENVAALRLWDFRICHWQMAKKQELRALFTAKMHSISHLSHTRKMMPVASLW